MTTSNTKISLPSSRAAFAVIQTQTSAFHCFMWWVLFLKQRGISGCTLSHQKMWTSIQGCVYLCTYTVRNTVYQCYYTMFLSQREDKSIAVVAWDHHGDLTLKALFLSSQLLRQILLDNMCYQRQWKCRKSAFHIVIVGHNITSPKCNKDK